MKKAAIVLAMVITAGAALAYIEEYTTSDIKTLQGTGFSQDALQIVDTARMLRQGTQKDYVPYFERKIYSDKPVVKWYQAAKRYLDPAQDENIFGVREVHYNNSFFDLSPSYNPKVTPNDKYNRLIDKDVERLETAGKVVPGSNGIEQTRETIEDL